MIVGRITEYKKFVFGFKKVSVVLTEQVHGREKVATMHFLYDAGVTVS